MPGRFAVKLTPSFQKGLEDLPRREQERVLAALKRLEAEPFGPDGESSRPRRVLRRGDEAKGKICAAPVIPADVSPVVIWSDGGAITVKRADIRMAPSGCRRARSSPEGRRSR